MDIDDVHKKFGAKYDQGIEEMKGYTDELLEKPSKEGNEFLDIFAVYHSG